MPPNGRLAVAAGIVLAVASARSPLRAVALCLVGISGAVAVLAGWVWATRHFECRSTRGARQAAASAQSGGGPIAPTTLAQRHWLGVAPFYFTSPAAWSMTQTKAAWEASPDTTRGILAGAPPFLQDALDSLLALILRDFVKKWYSTLSDSPVFPMAVDRTIRETLVALAGRVSAVDWSEVLVGRILPLVTAHLETINAADAAVHAGLADSDETDLFVASRYAELKGSRLHPAVDVVATNSRPAEEVWLRDLFGAVLPLIVSEREMDSAAVRVMVREIVASAVMLPVFELLSDPDLYNRMIDDKAGAALRDRKMVHEFREALDIAQPAVGKQLPQSPLRTAARRKTELVTVHTSARQFDAWLANISTLATLGEARRLRSDVTSQIRRAKVATDGRALNEVVNGVKVADWTDFVQRLYTARRKIDRRIAKLGGTDLRDRAPSVMSSPISQSQPTLRDLMLDPSAATYFMEFLDRRRRSARAQFWLLVEGLKDPLEEPATDQPTTTTSTPEDSTVVSNDIRMIWEAHLARDPFGSNPSYLEIVRAFVERMSESQSSVSAQDLRQVRHALLTIQHDVLALLEEEDLPAFRRSELHFKAVSAMISNESSPSAILTPPSPVAVRPLRPRSRSNPLAPSLNDLASAGYVVRPPASPIVPPARPVSPAFHAQARVTKPHRTETAPPQVTFQTAAFNRPSTRRPDLFDSAEPVRRDPVRKVSGASLETTTSVASAPAGYPKRADLADSLEFLMSPPLEVDRSPLFGTEGSSDQTAGQLGHMDEDETLSDDADDYVQVETIEAIQEALNSILATDALAQPEGNRSTTSLSSLQRETMAGPATRRVSADAQDRATLRTSPSASGPPSPSPAASSTGFTSARAQTLPPPLPPRSRARGVFDDAETIDDIDVDGPLESDFDPSSLVLPGPGDLHLPAEITRLSEALAKLKGQQAVVDALIRKAELTGNASELKLLIKSRESLLREIRATTFQKDQYEAQASENELARDRTRVSIPGTTVSQASGTPGAQSFQLYLVEVHQLNSDGTFKAGWIVTRRYSEFSALHGKLKDKFVAARSLDFPSKRLVGIWSKEFIEQRREGLERYLQALIRIDVVCKSDELRAFLSRQTIALPKSDVARKVASPLLPGQALRSLYRGFTTGIDDVLGTSTTSMVDTIVSRLGQQAAEFSGLGDGGAGRVNDEDLVGQLAASDGTVVSDQVAGSTGSTGKEGLTYFTAPICDLFITVFELKERNNWLRRQAILIVLQQVLGGTIERKFRDSVKMLLAPPQLAGYLTILQDTMWPRGELKPKEPPRTAAQKAATKESARRKLAALMPDIAANLIGRHNAKQGAKRLFAVLQNRRLNKHLVYSIVDEVVAVLFPELREQRTRPLFLS